MSGFWGGVVEVVIGIGGFVAHLWPTRSRSASHTGKSAGSELSEDSELVADKEKETEQARAAEAAAVAQRQARSSLGMVAPPVSVSDSASAVAARTAAAKAAIVQLDALYDAAQKSGKKLIEAKTSEEKQAALLTSHDITKGADGTITVNPSKPDNTTPLSVRMYIAVLAATADGSPVIHVQHGSTQQLGHLLVALLAHDTALPAEKLKEITKQLQQDQDNLPVYVKENLETILKLSEINTKLVEEHPDMNKEERHAALAKEAERLNIPNAARVLTEVAELPLVAQGKRETSVTAAASVPAKVVVTKVITPSDHPKLDVVTSPTSTSVLPPSSTPAPTNLTEEKDKEPEKVAKLTSIETVKASAHAPRELDKETGKGTRAKPTRTSSTSSDTPPVQQVFRNGIVNSTAVRERSASTPATIPTLEPKTPSPLIKS